MSLLAYPKSQKTFSGAGRSFSRGLSNGVNRKGSIRINVKCAKLNTIRACSILF